MRRFVMLALLVILGVMTWRLGTSLSSDALGMAVGVVFGVLAGIPCAAGAGDQQPAASKEDDRSERYDRYTNQRRDRQLPAYPYQPPVIVVAGAPAPQAAPPPLGQGPALCSNQTNSWEPQRGNGGSRWWGNGRSGN
ncbi:MAG: hypothetical protein U0X20_30470 [Caldilineaceae bacterium]